MQGGRKLSSWNLFVKKIYAEGKKSDKNYSFKKALSDASRRKGEMGSMTSSSSSSKSKKATKKRRMSRRSKSGRAGTKKRR